MSTQNWREYVSDEQYETITKELESRFKEGYEAALSAVEEKLPPHIEIGEGTYCLNCKGHIAAGECDCWGKNKYRDEALKTLASLRTGG